MRLQKDYIIIQCKDCTEEISVWKYALTRKIPHSGLCRKCSMKHRSKAIEDKTDRDTIYLRKQLRNIKARCSGKYEVYASYTRRQTEVCKEWVDNPDSFVAWAKSNGWNRNLTIDRIDNEDDYTPENCRWITNKHNVLAKEVSRKSRGKSKYIGVWFRKDTNRWSAEIKIDKKKKSLGCYDTEEEAMLVRDKYIIDNNIEFLKLNRER